MIKPLRLGLLIAFSLCGFAATAQADAAGIGNLSCQGRLSLTDRQNASDADRKQAQRLAWCRARYEGVEGWVDDRIQTEGSAPAQKAIESEAAPEEPGTRWRLVGSPAGPATGDAWLSIWPNGDIRGNTGCNNFFASGSFGEGSFQLTGPIGATRKLCPEDAVNKQETAVFSALERAVWFDFNLTTGTLRVMDDDAETLLELQVTD